MSAEATSRARRASGTPMEFPPSGVSRSLSDVNARIDLVTERVFFDVSLHELLDAETRRISYDLRDQSVNVVPSAPSGTAVPSPIIISSSVSAIDEPVEPAGAANAVNIIEDGDADN